MLLPIRTEVARRRPTLITYWIIGVCSAIFLVTTVLENRSPDLYNRIIEFGALHGDFSPSEDRLMRLAERSKASDLDPLGILAKWRLGEVNPAKPWQYITYQFLHAGWMHLLGNMIVLWVFGPVVEDRLRRWWFLAFYLVAGAFAGFIHSLFEARVIDTMGISMRTVAPVIGASGSIAGVTGAFLVLFPQSRIDIIWFFGIVGRFSIPAWWFIGLAIARDFISKATSSGGVANMAHIGGYTFGASIALLALWRGWIPREPFNLFTMGVQAKRRRAYRELVRSAGSAYLADSAKAALAPTRPGASDRSLDRAAIADALRAGNLDLAAERFATLLDTAPDEVLPRDQQITIANHWFAKGRYAHAAAAYESFLRRFPDDRERAQTTLMLALVSARYLNDPVKASAMLATLNEATLSDDHKALAQTLRKEIA